jgi:hypothetical protein
MNCAMMRGGSKLGKFIRTTVLGLVRPIRTMPTQMGIDQIQDRVSLPGRDLARKALSKCRLLNCGI